MLHNPFRSKVKIIHRPGLVHSNVDPLSRFPVQAWTSTPTWISMPHTSTAETLVSRDSVCSRLQDVYENDEYWAGYWHDARRYQSVTDMVRLG